MSSHLSGGRINVALLQETYRKELLFLLEKCQGTKAIIWDDSLAGPMGLVAKYSLLKEHDVVKMFKIQSGPLPPLSVRHVIFISRPDTSIMDLIATNLLKEERISTSGIVKKDFHLFFLPRKSLLCEERLKNRGVFGSFTLVEELKCHLFPFDSDVMSMELPNAFRELYLEGDPTCIHQSAQALMSLQMLFGPFNKVYGEGQNAKQVWDLLCRMSKQEDLKQSQTSVDQLIIIERATDLVSPLATQLTYEGLIDELFGISNTTATFPAKRFADQDENNQDLTTQVEIKQIILNSSDELFAELRDKNFNAVGAALSKQARLISSQFEERHGDKSVQEIKQFVARLPHMLANKQALATHTAIAEYIKEMTVSFSFEDTLQCEQDFLIGIDTDKPNPYLEDLIAQGVSLVKVLRLLCLQSVTGSGLKQKVLDYYKREIVQVYGLNAFLTLMNLENAGLLRLQASTRQYAVLRKTLNLIVEDTSEVNPTDISYVHSIYAPISVRIAEHVAKCKKWQELQDSLGVLPGPLFADSVPVALGHSRRGSLASENSNTDTPRVILVFFLGGCTYAEISALRFLSQKEEYNVEFVIATTKIISGNSFIKTLMEPMPE